MSLFPYFYDFTRILSSEPNVNSGYKTTMKSIGDDFTNILRAAFYVIRSQNHKNIVKPSVFFVLLGSAHINCLPKMLVKSTPAVKLTIFMSLI